jgi:hypothetical protein
MNDEHVFTYSWVDEMVEWGDCLGKPNTDEQKYGSADRPPKYWLEMKAVENSRLIYGHTTMNVRPRYGLD